MEISSPSEAYVAWSISYWRDVDVIDWAIRKLSNSNSDEVEDLLQEIAWINTKQKREIQKAGLMLQSYVLKDKEKFQFSAFEKDAKQMLADRIQQYLNGDCHPYHLCQMVDPIEQCFDFPSWLGDLFSSCDWCEPDSNPSDYHLEETAKRVLNAL